jgi:hypothetical protein
MYYIWFLKRAIKGPHQEQAGESRSRKVSALTARPIRQNPQGSVVESNVFAAGTKTRVACKDN